MLTRKSVIKSFTKEGCSPKNIHENSPSYFKHKFGWKQFTCGKEHIHDVSKCGRPLETRSEEVFTEVENLVLAENVVKVSVVDKEWEYQKQVFIVKLLCKDLLIS